MMKVAQRLSNGLAYLHIEVIRPEINSYNKFTSLLSRWLQAFGNGAWFIAQIKTLIGMFGSLISISYLPEYGNTRLAMGESNIVLSGSGQRRR